MAASTVPPENDWQKVRRIAAAARFHPTISIRSSGAIAVSADFVRMADIAQCSRVTLFLSRDGLRLAFRFHSDQSDDDAFVLASDGGAGRSRGTLNKVITAKALLAQSPVIAALIKESNAVRRFEPQRDQDGRWVIHLAPCFERTVASQAEIDAAASGIYRYRLGGETVYIGRGILRQRLAMPDRKGWQFDRIEFSILNDEPAERRWEAYWIDEYRRRQGRLPLYNKIAAIAAAAAG